METTRGGSLTQPLAGTLPGVAAAAAQPNGRIMPVAKAISEGEGAITWARRVKKTIREFFIARVIALIARAGRA